MIEQEDLLFELGTEELPPLALARLAETLAQEFGKGLDKANLSHGEIKSYATPRRLAIIANGCAVKQPDQNIERRGPAVQAAFDETGEPTQAATGFARSCGTQVDQLSRLKTDKGEWLAYEVNETGKPATELLAEIAETALNRLPIPKRMRWGESEHQFVRPTHWLLFLHGKNVVACDLFGLSASQQTYGHRFHHPQAIQISQPDDYVAKLETAKVIVDLATRRERIHSQVTELAKSLHGSTDIDEPLLDEVSALVEWPVAVAASFEGKYLQVPHEALIYTMKKNQKYFPVLNEKGDLTRHFVTISNIESTNPEVIRDGNERVIRPRLADAMFFWEQDGKTPLADHGDSLKSVIFQKKLGSLFDKSERVASLAMAIAAMIDGDEALAERAAKLSRCDLMTETVGELPEMQGIMGMYQARRDQEPEELALAMNEFYMPRFSGDALPQTKTGIAISLAEKLDTLAGIFALDMKPTGDKDPFALRRAALGALRILKEHALPLDLKGLLIKAADQLPLTIDPHALVDDIYAFMLSRLKGIYLEKEVSAETFEAVAHNQPDNIADFDKRINAVIAFQSLPESEALAAANKRIKNILKKSGIKNYPEIKPELFEQDEERTLHNMVSDLSDKITPLILNSDYEATLILLASLRDTVDTFFDEVMVMTDDKGIKNNRLALLDRLHHLFAQVADISRL